MSGIASRARGSARRSSAAARPGMRSSLIVLVQAMSLLDRQVLAILVPRIRADLHVGAAEMGLLYGTVFALFYAIFSLPLGRLADGWVRTKLLSISILGWSVMTALAGFANGFGLLALSRLGVGIGEASSQPAGMSLLADSFPKEKRGMISAAMAIAVALGLGAALFVGGDRRRQLGCGLAGRRRRAARAQGLAGGVHRRRSARPAARLAALAAARAGARRRRRHRAAPRSAPVPRQRAARSSRSCRSASGRVSRGRVRPARLWIVNLAGSRRSSPLAVVLLTGWTDGLRAENPVALRIGGARLHRQCAAMDRLGLRRLCAAQLAAVAASSPTGRPMRSSPAARP